MGTYVNPDNDSLQINMGGKIYVDKSLIRNRTGREVQDGGTPHVRQPPPPLRQDDEIKERGYAPAFRSYRGPVHLVAVSYGSRAEGRTCRIEKVEA